MEKWKTVDGYPKYMISDNGLVKSNFSPKGRMLKGAYYYGYKTVFLYGEKNRTYFIHRLVAKAFIPNPENKPQVNHKNGVRDDNRLENLEWCTAKENMQHAWDMGLSKISENHNIFTNHPTRGKYGINNKKSKKLLQSDMDNAPIKIWSSTMDVERELGYDHTCISSACLGKIKYAYGFKWKYIICKS